MSRSVPEGEIRRLGDRALLIGVADAAAGRSLAAELAERLRAEVDIVCGSATVMVHAAAPTDDISSVRAAVDESRAALAERGAREVAPGPGRLVTIPCRFDGPDLDDVAALAGCGVADVPALLTAQPLTAAFMGFSPGFAYLGGLPRPLDRVPRRARPRPVVPAGSVAIANGQAAVYPTSSPGGWQLIGRTSFPLFGADRPPYAVLAPGDRVQFTVAGPDERVEPEPVRAPPWSLPPEARPVFAVVRPGLRAVVQDGGRRAVAGIGVPSAGPADPVSFALANRLVGNTAGAGAVEVTGGEASVRCLMDCHVGVVGAAPDVRVDDTTEDHDRLLPLRAGQQIHVGRLHGGCRTYLAVAGGVLGPVWFGSAATDELTGLGAGALRVGSVVHAGRWAPPLGDHVAAGAATVLDDVAPVLLRVLPGPHGAFFPPDALAQLAAAVFEVQSASNRVGMRLRAEEAVPAAPSAVGEGALDSQGVVTGAVQVPPDGDPVVLLPDHATLGGYPVLAVVATVDHGRLGQCAPGTRVRFVPIDHAAAGAARTVARRELARAVVGTYPLAVE
jgi:KipI family sensor histidine kinase inhibitor